MQSTNKKGRSSTSCTECQRRKQKVRPKGVGAARKWPLPFAIARFATNTPRSVRENGPAIIVKRGKFLIYISLRRKDLSWLLSQKTLLVTWNWISEKSDEIRGRKRSQPDATDTSSNGVDGEQDEPEDGLKIWGYMPGHYHHQLGRLDPPWWSDRAKGRTLSPEFTCLLLRVLSYSVQYLTPELRKMIEFELACSPQILTGRLNSAADQMSQSVSASNTCIERVQELFYKGAWLKSESRIVESWHSLGRTIREAQELGLDKESSNEGFAEFEVEIRRRLWTLLYVWDWQMSAWLGRPHLIDQKDLSFRFPTLRLDQSTAEPNHLSPFAHIVLQAQVARRIAPVTRDVQAFSDLSPEQVSTALKELRNFIDELPPIFRVENPDTSLDEKHPYYVFQRHKLHVVIYMGMLDLLKPYLTRDPKAPKSPHDAALRTEGVDIALKLLSISHLLFVHQFPINAKFHLVVFSIFDTATTLCSAMIHDVDVELLHREAIMDAVESALNMLQQLSLSTKLGASSYWFLYKLVQAAPGLSQHGPISKREKLTSTAMLPRNESSASGSVEEVKTPPPEQPLPTSVPPPVPLEMKETAPAVQFDPVPVLGMATTDDIAFDMEQYLAQNPFGSAANLDIGGMEVVFDWDELNLDWSVLGDGSNPRIQ
ncbi:hypothetical protein BU23DRAFT_566161 [Bimuria novae-zelandiae CBS 107.79]|uniref:Xylanolytic transcriptional activator regulatory domain-containing protein n=1 Tax=Bimuria novae-zelandiae CBS 107.79 TaxID=1447943 RepID=A0A6A5VRS3_9PLEO|nr:hypothetical protein BU23DRAFT_566161 [Bimuria novae-zelandiae CBS 107.79]